MLSPCPQLPPQLHVDGAEHNSHKTYVQLRNMVSEFALLGRQKPIPWRCWHFRLHLCFLAGHALAQSCTLTPSPPHQPTLGMCWGPPLGHQAIPAGRPGQQANAAAFPDFIQLPWSFTPGGCGNISGPPPGTTALQHSPVLCEAVYFCILENRQHK